MFHPSPKNVSPEGKSVSVTFYLKPLKTNATESSIMTRIVYGRKKVEFGTGLRIPTVTWSERKQESNVSAIINRRLSKIKNEIYDTKLMLDNKGVHYTVKDIKNHYLGDESNRPTLLEFWDSFINHRKTSGECRPSTLTKYRSTQKYLHHFLKSISSTQLLAHQWDKKKIKEFDLFLNHVVIDNRGGKMMQTTINKHHVKLKTILNYAIQLEIIQNNPYNGWKLSFPYKSREYLDDRELDLIENVNLEHNPSLDKARNIFLFSCYTGLRYGDTQLLLIKNIHWSSDQAFIRMEQQKTKDDVYIPLIKRALDILCKYEDLPERLIQGRALPQLSNQKLNFYLKAVADVAGLDKGLTHHMARHTCATTILLDNDVSMEITSRILGHQSIKTTQIYGRITNSQVHRAMEKIKR